MTGSWRRWGAMGAFGIVFFSAAITSRAALPFTTVSYDTPLLWTDRLGTTHAAANINVEWWDDDSVYGEGGSEQYLGYGVTDATGNLAVIVPEDDWGSQIEFFTVIRAAVQNVAVVKDQFADTDPYRRRNPYPSGLWDVNEGTTTTVPGGVTLDNSTFTGTSVGILQHIKFMNSYYGAAPYNAALPFIDIRHNSSVAGSSMGKNKMNLAYTDWCDPDVIFHEYGHHVAEHNDLDYRDVNGNGLGLDHYYANDNISGNNDGTNYGETDGSRLAWQEGIATYLGMVAVHRGNLNGAILNQPLGDVDLWYDNLKPAPGATYADNTDIDFSVNIETKQRISHNGNTGRNGGTYTTTNHNVSTLGEGNESSVMRVLWDFQDDGADNEAYGAGRGDRARLGATKVYNTMKTSDTFNDFWVRATADALADKTQVDGLTALSHDHETLAALGETLEEYGISGKPTTSGNIADTTPRLYFNEQNNSNSRKFKFLVMDSDWDLVTSFTFSDNNLGLLQNWYWDVDTVLTLGESYYYTVLNSAAILLNAAPVNNKDWYWSGANSFTIIPEPSAALALLPLLSAAVLMRDRRRRS